MQLSIFLNLTFKVLELGTETNVSNALPLCHIPSPQIFSLVKFVAQAVASVHCIRRLERSPPLVRVNHHVTLAKEAGLPVTVAMRLGEKGGTVEQPRGWMK